MPKHDSKSTHALQWNVSYANFSHPNASVYRTALLLERPSADSTLCAFPLLRTNFKKSNYCPFSLTSLHEELALDSLPSSIVGSLAVRFTLLLFTS